MRKWCVAVAMGALFALPLCAQQKATSAAGKPEENLGSSATASATAGDFSIAPASRTLFAMPAAAAAHPADIFSDWDNNAWNRHEWGRLTPKWEVAGMFQYINFCACGAPGWNNYGATGSLTYNANNWLGLTAELGGYHFNREEFILNGTTFAPMKVTGGFETYLFGPRVNIRRFNYIVPFFEFLVGGAHSGAQLTGSQTQSAFTLAAGGGVDLVLTKSLTWRFMEADYLMTNFNGPELTAEGRQHNFRIGTGVVLRWGYPPEPPKPIHPPTAACSADKSSIYQGSTDVVGIHVAATDVDKVGLTYSYTAAGGTLDGNGPDARWNPTGLAIGSYTINVKVDNGHGGTATCATDVAVVKRPNRPPVISCAPERNPIIAGERVAIISKASDPDGDPITYSYATTGGQISGNGPTVQFDSTGLSPGSYTVTCTADDGQGARTPATTALDVKEPPEIKELEAKLSLRDVYFPTAQPTVANPNGGLLASQQKTLDALASDFARYLALKKEAHLILEGHADIRGSKQYNLKLSERRVARVKNYLIEHGVPADHLDTIASGDEKNLTAAEVKALIEQDTALDAATRQKVLKNLPTIVLANNRRVDISLSTTGQKGVRGLPFNAEDAATLISRSAAETKKAGKPAAKPAPAPAPKKAPKP